MNKSKEEKFKEALEMIANLQIKKPFFYDSYEACDGDWTPADTGNYDDTFDQGISLGYYEAGEIAREALKE